MKLAYLMNQHPYASCTFIRREILQLEQLGHSVSRFSIRYPELDIKDEADKKEVDKTEFLLQQGALKLLGCFLKYAVARPSRWFQTLRLTLLIGQRSERGLLVNLIYMVEACLLVDRCHQLGIEHLHAHFATNSAAVAMLSHALGGPSYSFTVHGPHEFDKPEAIALTEKINRAKFVVGISSFTKSQLLRWCDYKQWGKIHIVHCGVDQMFLAHPPTPLPPEPRFVCVGRISEQKGHMILIDAVSQLAVQGLKFKVVLVGDGPLRSQVEALIAQLHLEDHVIITGWATNSEVQQAVLRSQVMVAPSFAEGLPVVVMEALALGRPVLATYIAGTPELVVPGECGWLVPAGNADALAAAMRQVIETPLETLTRMGQQGAQRVAAEHHVATEAQKLHQLFLQYHTVADAVEVPQVVATVP